MSTLDHLYSALIAADAMIVPRGPYHLLPKGATIEDLREDIRWAQLPERRRCAYCRSNHSSDGNCPNCGAPDRTPPVPKITQWTTAY